jgi:hypothetical protein
MAKRVHIEVLAPNFPYLELILILIGLGFASIEAQKSNDHPSIEAYSPYSKVRLAHQLVVYGIFV